MNYKSMKKADLIELLEHRDALDAQKEPSRKELDLLIEKDDLSRELEAQEKYVAALDELVNSYRLYKSSPEVYSLEDVMTNLETISDEMRREDGIPNYVAQITLI